VRTWPAIDVDVSSVTEGWPDLFQAALVDLDAAAIDETAAYRVFFHHAEARDRALAALRADFPHLLMRPIDVPDEDWAARSQASLQAIRVGDIIVAPPWDVPPAPDAAGSKGLPHESKAGLREAGEELGSSADVQRGLAPHHVIVIQPSMGFGTGHHATTRLCLAALQELNLHGRTVLDVGTGSGVLAIAARKLGASRSGGIDDDPDAIQAARENAALNRGAEVHLQVLDLRSAALSPFDVVVANLTGGLLLATADRLCELTAARGALVLSGFMDEEEAQVLASFGTMQVADRRQEDEWIAVTLRRRGVYE
jgi:ribosomal protein L11 methyltransferase